MFFLTDDLFERVKQQVLPLGGGDLLQDEGQVLWQVPHCYAAQCVRGRRFHLRHREQVA